MEVRPISDPFPVWDRIKTRMQDQSGNLTTEGRFYGVFDDEKMAGAFLVKPWSTYCLELHGGVHPDYFGQGIEICRLMGLALFRGTPCLKIVCIVPEFNRLMIRCLEKNGMKREGRIKDSFLKWMKLHDMIIFGISKTEVPECHPQQ